MEYLPFLKQLFELIVGFGAVLGTLYAGYKFLHKKYKIYKDKKELADKKREETDKKIDHIFKEMTPNGGGSLKDKINRMNDQLSSNTDNTNKCLELTKTIFTRQRWMLDQRNEPIFESNNKGECVWVNDKYLHFLRTSKEECLGHGWKNFIHIDDRDKVIHLWEDSIKDNRAFEARYKMVSEDKEIYEVSCLAVKTSDNGYIGTLKILDTKSYKE